MPEKVAVEFHCHICAEPSETLCKWCTKDSCENHLCPDCQRCSDCCDCDLRKPSYEHEGGSR